MEPIEITMLDKTSDENKKKKKKEDEEWPSARLMYAMCQKEDSE